MRTAHSRSELDSALSSPSQSFSCHPSLLLHDYTIVVDAHRRGSTGRGMMLYIGGHAACPLGLVTELKRCALQRAERNCQVFLYQKVPSFAILSEVSKH